ncbi:MAG: helix-turn-helix domain-containing protein [Gemmatimonadota bacterium]|jgi:transcriptional regulator with XRE-family HTH domain|nr:helix-turn-helix transcriptional regulator [Planctomycetota bacterium]
MGSAQSVEYKRFLTRLIQAREEAGLTQKEAAEPFRQDQAWMSKVERGVRRLDVIELSKLARLYKKPARYFVPEFPPES